MFSVWSKNPIRFLAMTGYTLELFHELLPYFKLSHHEYLSRYHLDGRRRKNLRQFVIYSSSPLLTIEDRLAFVLSYKKLNPIQELQAHLFNMSQKQCNEFIHGLTTILQMALSDAGAMPATTEKQLMQKLLTDKDAYQILLHDGTEREIPRPKDEDAQKENYSDKKGRHTLKNAVISTTLCLVLYVSVSLSGATHDKKIADQCYANAFESLDYVTTLWQDTGYQGFAPKNVTIVQPTKKPRGNELTKEQKKYNRLISSFRVRVEHTIGSIKRYRIVKDECRLRKNNYPKKVFAICAGLHNFRLKFIPFNYPDVKLT